MKKTMIFFLLFCWLISGTATAVAQDTGQRRQAGDKTFVYRNGVWFDTAYDPVAHPVYGVRTGSVEHQLLREALPELYAYETLGGRVLFVYQAWAYEIGAKETAVSIRLPPRPINTVRYGGDSGRPPHLIAAGAQPALSTNERQWLLLLAVVAVPALIGVGVWLERWNKRPS